MHPFPNIAVLESCDCADFSLVSRMLGVPLTVPWDIATRVI